VGIVGALAIAAWRGQLTLAMLRDVCEATVRTTPMVVAILVGAFFLNVVIQTYRNDDQFRTEKSRGFIGRLSPSSSVPPTAMGAARSYIRQARRRS
jgi:hypothetical protein